MSMQFDAVSRPRSMSAKVGPSRNRPLSGMTTTTIRIPNKNLKTQLITSIYHGKQKSPSKRGLNKNLLYTGISTEQLAKFKRTSNVQIAKEKQQLYEENIQLKREINRLSEQLAIVKGKNQNKSKKLLSKQKQLDRQFEKQLYWAGSKTHLIQGIKYQYEKLKNDHVNLRKQYSDLKKALIQSSVPEYKIYSEAIEVENKRLAERIRKIAETTQLTLQNMHPDKEVTLAILAQSEQNKLRLQQKLIQLDIQLRNANESLKDRDKKIEFLQKLIIEKDNKQFHIGRKLKRTEKSKEQLQELIIGLKLKINEIERQAENSQRKLLMEFQKEKNRQDEKYSIQIHQLSERIKILEEENKILELAVNKLRMSSSNLINNNNTINTNRSINNPSSASFRKNNSPIDMLGEKKQTKNFESTQSKNLGEELERQRRPKRADKKRSQSSKKMRKVDIEEVKQIGQLIRYRMINLSINSQELKQFFSYKEEKSGQTGSVDPESGPEVAEWKKNYINMQEVQQIIKSSPFNLDQDYAFCLSRYLIQDCHLQYVYCDSGNENTRDIVKSIIKTLVGDYNLPEKTTISKAQQFLNKYEMNLESVLKTYYPGGKISKRKLVDTIKGLGVEVEEAVGQYLVARASWKSFRMDEILYNHLFLKDAC